MSDYDGFMRVLASRQESAPILEMTLFDLSPHPRHRHTDPETSINAARSADNVEHLIRAIFHGGGNYTDDELCAALPDHYPPSVKTARSRLSGRGLLVDTGARRPSLRGREMIVWKAV